MRLKSAPDYYSALALLAHSGCTFTQAGSQIPQASSIHSLSASWLPTPAPAGNISYLQGIAASAPSMAESTQELPGTNIGATPHLSGRPSPPSSSPMKLISRASGCSEVACGSEEDLAIPRESFVSPFGSNPSPIRETMGSGFNVRRESGFMRSRNPQTFIPVSSSDPMGVSTETGTRTTTEDPPSICLPTAARPSTAPSFDSPTLSQMLPPRRELPFKRPTTALIAAADRFEDPSSGGPRGPIADVGREEDGRAAKRPKRTTAKCAALATRAPNLTPAASRPVQESAGFQDLSPTPSVESLLTQKLEMSGHKSNARPAGQVMGSASGATLGVRPVHPMSGRETDDSTDVSHTHERGASHSAFDSMTGYSSNIDTQKLLTLVEEHQKGRTFNGEAKPRLSEKPLLSLHQDTALEAASADVPASPKSQRVGTSVGEPIEGVRRSTRVRTRTFQNSFIPKKPSATDVVCRDSTFSDKETRTASAESGGQIPAKMTEIKEPKAAERRPLGEVTNVSSSNRPQSLTKSTVRALMNDPDFARSPEIARWADLPAQEREATLETWMCQQLESESFATLLKTMEGMWQRLFFGD
jgi:hypothetical protein